MSNGCWSKSVVAVSMSFSVARSSRTFSIVFFWPMLLFALLKSAMNFLYFLISLFILELSSESWKAFCLNLYSIPKESCALFEKTSKRNSWDLHVMFLIESFIQTPLSYFSHSLESWLYKVSSLNWSRRISADPLSPLKQFYGEYWVFQKGIDHHLFQ